MYAKTLPVVTLLVAAQSCFAGDWPQILGPARDGKAIGEKLIDWPTDGPESAWSEDVGEGFAGVSVRGNLLVLFHRVDSQEVVEARSAETGQKIWSTAFPCRFQSAYSSDNGPRCVPMIAGGRIYVFGVTGMLRCLDAASGKEVWHRDTWKDFSAPEGYFGAGSSPVLHGDRLIVNVGGRDDAAVVAFSKKDGSTLWQVFDDRASYSSPVVANVGGVSHAFVVTRLNALSVDPADGSIRFQFPFGARGPTVNGASPVVIGNSIFLSASYRVGSVRAEFSAEASQPKSSGETLLATQYATPIAVDHLLYAVDGRQDAGPGSASLKCINPETEQVLWQKDGFDYGSLVLVGDEFLFLTCGGELIRFRLSSSEYQEVSRHTVLADTPRGYRLPAISNGRLYVRDDRQLKCLNVGETR